MAIQESLQEKLFSDNQRIQLRHVSADELDARRDGLEEEVLINESRVIAGVTTLATCLFLNRITPPTQTLPVRALRLGFKVVAVAGGLFIGLSSLRAKDNEIKLELIEKENRYRNGS